MGNIVYPIVTVMAAIAAVGTFAYWIATRKRIAAETIGRAEEEARRLLRDAEREGEARKKEALLEAKDKAHELRMEAERQAQERRQQIGKLEQVLSKKEEKVAERLAAAEQAEKELRAREQAVKEREKATAAAAARCDEMLAEQQRELHRVSGLTADEAREILLKQLEADARRDAANMVKRLEAEARESAAAKAKRIVAEAIQRSAPEHAIETTVSVIDLPSDDLKGRIIGREGRNIRALEIATGVDLIVDDTPGAIILSGFDPYRREIAKQAIERLITDGRIHPARIEEVVEKVRTELDESVRREGEAAAFELGLHDLHPEVHALMGRLRFRTSYGQNVLTHSKEVAYLAGIMARELGLDAHLTVRAAFLHDIGKVGIEDAILLKPGQLTPQEQKRMRQHTLIGGRCLQEIERRLGTSNFLEMVRQVVPRSLHDFPISIEPHHAIDDATKQTRLVEHANRHEIRAGAGVIETGQTDGAADGGGQGTLLAGGFVPRPYMLNA